MGTKVVKKGAGRPAHAARTKKHAQRTPLPPKGGKGTSRTAREDKLDESRPGTTKAVAFAAFAREHEWAATVKQEKDRIEVVASSDDGTYKESITVEWVAGRQGPVVYQVNGRTVSMRNVGAARRHISEEAPIKKDAAPRRERKHALVVRDDGTVREETPKHLLAKPVTPTSDAVMLHARGEGRPPTNMGPLTPDGGGIESMKASLERDGYIDIWCEAYPGTEDKRPDGDVIPLAKRKKPPVKAKRAHKKAKTAR